MYETQIGTVRLARRTLAFVNTLENDKEDRATYDLSSCTLPTPYNAFWHIMAFLLVASVAHSDDIECSRPSVESLTALVLATSAPNLVFQSARRAGVEREIVVEAGIRTGAGVHDARDLEVLDRLSLPEIVAAGRAAEITLVESPVQIVGVTAIVIVEIQRDRSPGGHESPGHQQGKDLAEMHDVLVEVRIFGGENETGVRSAAI